MIPAQTNRLALVTDDAQNAGDDASNPMAAKEADALAWDLVSANIEALMVRVSKLEAMERKHRAVINQIVTRFATEGRPLPPEAA